MHGKIDTVAMNKFRIGSWEEADAATKAKYEFFILTLGRVVSVEGGRREVWESKLCSKIMDVTTEAFLYWTFRAYGEEWEKELENQLSDDTSSDQEPPRKKRKSGMHPVNKYWREFYQYVQELKDIRETGSDEEGQGWDEAIKTIAINKKEQRMAARLAGEQYSEQSSSAGSSESEEYTLIVSASLFV